MSPRPIWRDGVDCCLRIVRAKLIARQPIGCSRAAALCASIVLLACVPAGAQIAQLCGDMDGSGSVAASDALLLLKKAVGQNVVITCPSCSGLAATIAPTTCGDVDASGSVAASDALLLLKKAVGQNVNVSCPACSTTTTTIAGVTTTTLGGQTTTTSGEVTTTTNGGQTTTTIGAQTTTTLAGPEGCGNGVVDGEEQCEGLEGCASGDQCTAQCTCELIDDAPPTSQDLIAQALAAGEIDYPTSLEYRVWALFHAPELPEQLDGAGSSGEDTALFFEIGAVRDTLPPAIESAVAPYLVRPTDPASIYSTQVQSSFTAALAETATPPPVNCPDDGTGHANWGFFETEHFVVWSCDTGRCVDGKPAGTFCETSEDCDTSPGAFDGVCNTATDATRRLVAGTVAEEAYAKMTPRLGPPRADDYAFGPEPTGRIDIYVLRPNECRLRSGECKPVKGGIAAATPDTPCDGDAGPMTSSGYVRINAQRIPLEAPASDEPSTFRADLVHELFHVYEFASNLEAISWTCALGPTGNGDRGSWLTEASAEWASFGFFPKDDYERRETLFYEFQTNRDATVDGLHSTDGLRPYEAALYLQFLQQEAGDISPAIGLWTTNQHVRSRAAFNQHLNQISSFSEYFREFAVRDFNRELPGDPISPMFADLPDKARTRGLSANVLKPPHILKESSDHPGRIKLAPLFAQFEHYRLRDEVRWVRVDVTDVGNFEHLDLDAIEHVGSEWRREKIDGPYYEFCRDDEERDVDEFFLVISNRDLDIDGKAEGQYMVKTRAACPGAWSGTFTYLKTVDSHEEFEGGAYTYYVSDSHERQEQFWSITGSVLVEDEFDPYDELTLAWHGRAEISGTTQWGNDQCGFYQEQGTKSGSGTATDRISASPIGDGVYYLQVLEESDTPIEGTSQGVYTNCEASTPGESPVVLGYDSVVVPLSHPDAMVNISPTAGDPNHYKGEATILHTETPKPGGMLVVDEKVRWDLRRHPAPAAAQALRPR